MQPRLLKSTRLLKQQFVKIDNAARQHATINIHVGAGINLRIHTCYRTLQLILDSREGKPYMHYLLRIPHINGEYAGWFNHKAIVADINDVFKDYFKISLHLTHTKFVKIVQIKELQPKAIYAVQYIAYQYLFILLRLMDAENYLKWLSLERNSYEFPINNLEELCCQYYFACGRDTNHSLHEAIGKIYEHYKHNKKSNTLKLYRAMTIYLLYVLKSVFGSDFDLHDKRFVNVLEGYNWRYEDMSFGRGRIRQTMAFNYLENAWRCTHD